MYRIILMFSQTPVLSSFNLFFQVCARWQVIFLLEFFFLSKNILSDFFKNCAHRNRVSSVLQNATVPCSLVINCPMSGTSFLSFPVCEIWEDLGLPIDIFDKYEVSDPFSLVIGHCGRILRSLKVR